MKQVRFTNGYTTYVDRIYSPHCRNEVYLTGDGHLGRVGSDYYYFQTPFSDHGSGFSETWDTSICYSLIFNI